MKSILKVAIFAVLVQASFQQRLSCNFCQDCHASQWVQRSCDDDGPTGNPTTPGPIFPMAAQSIDINDTATFVDPSWQNWQCFTLTFNSNGRDITSRGCTPASGSHDDTCRNIVGSQTRIIWCDLCDRDNCNNSNYIYVSTLLLLSALMLIFKL